MERLGYDEALIQEQKAMAEGFYPGKETPAPGSNLKVYDDIRWLDLADARVLWGYDMDNFVVCYMPMFGSQPIPVEVGTDGAYITDRAPADPQAPAFPIYPEPDPEPQQQQGEGDDSERQHDAQRMRRRREVSIQEAREAVLAALDRVPEAEREQVRERIRSVRPELVAPDLGDHRHDAMPPPKSER